MWYGNTMILLIAGISSVSVSLFESAQIDGATSGQVFRKITLPLIRPIMLFTLVSSMIGGLQMFDIPKLLNDGKPAAYFRGTQIKSTETILMYIQTQAFGTGATHKVGLAAAVSVLLFVFTSICSGVLFYVMRDKEAGRMKKIAKMGGAIK
jgi:multiple sugar transport system permease protein